MPEENLGSSPASADTGQAGGGQPSGEQPTGQQQQPNGGASSGEGTRGDNTPVFAVPDEYKERGWAGKVHSQDDLFKQIDNLDKLVGEKTLKPIDYSTATEEEIAAYHKALAPEDRSAYSFSEPDEALSVAVGDAFIEAGVSEYQGKAIVKALAPAIEKMQQSQIASSTSEEGYTKLATEAFGENFKEAIGRSEAVIKEYAPDDNTKAAWDKMPNEQRIIADKTISRIVDGYEAKIAEIKKEYGVKESGAQGEGGQGRVATNVGEQRKQLRQQMQDMKTRPHTTNEYNELKAKLDATYQNDERIK